MKDRFYIGFLAGMIAPLLIIILFYLARFTYWTPEEFIRQAFILKVHFKIIAVGIFFADLGLFYLFINRNKNNASRGIILSVFIYFLFMLFSGQINIL